VNGLSVILITGNAGGGAVYAVLAAGLWQDCKTISTDMIGIPVYRYFRITDFWMKS
jgi:hypothetical protein